MRSYIKQKRRTAHFITAILIFMLTGATFSVKCVEAQWIVNDPPNTVANLATLAKMILNLKNLDGDWRAMIPIVEELERLIEYGDAISYSNPDVAAEFEEAYPGYVMPEGMWEEQNAKWVKTELDTLNGVLQNINLQSKDLRNDAKFAAGLLEQSNSAIGNLQALQAGNAITGNVAQQIIKLREVMMAQINVVTVAEATAVAKQAQVERKVADWAWRGGRHVPKYNRNDPRGVGEFNFLRRGRRR